jgi:hypothetical protein
METLVTGGHMNMSRKIFSLCAVVLLGILVMGSAAFGEVTDEGRISIVCGNHSVLITSASFFDAQNNVVASETQGLGCGGGGGGGASRIYAFPEVEITHFECWYTADGGPLTQLVLNSDNFFFHIPVVLAAPSPGGIVVGDAGMPVDGDAYMIVSDHDVLVWPAAECFRFTGGPHDYVAVTWYCESDYPPIFSITPGCGLPCQTTCPCTPAVFVGYGYTPAVEMIPNIWVRLFYPIGLVTPGCWCYYFEYQLSVELAAFHAISATNAVNLNFATASENDNDHFEVWRGMSKDDEFTKIGTVNSNGNSTTEQHYRFTDTDVNAGTTYFYYLVSVDAQGQRLEFRDRIQSATPTQAAIPMTYALSAYPNPFNPTTTLAFSLPEAANVLVNVYDVSGRLVSALVNTRYAEGAHQVAFDASSLPTGVYIARMETGKTTMTTKLLLVK